MPGTANSSVTAGDVALIAAVAVTSPLWVWFPIGAAITNVFSRPPPKEVSPVLLRYVKKLHRERCFATPFKKYFYKKLFEVQQAMRGYNHEVYNLVLCGETRVGKSSLINALLGLRDTDPGAARVDVVECTMSPTLYRTTMMPHLYMWDMPGAGTQAHSSHNYYTTKHLYAADALLLVVRDTILDVDAHIILQAQQTGQRVAIVRTHAEQQIRNLMRSRDLTAEAAAFTLKRTMFDNVVSELNKCGAKPNVEIFFVDRWAFRDTRFYTNSGIKLGTSDGLLDEQTLCSWLATLKRDFL